MVNVKDGAVCLTVSYLPETNQHCFVAMELLFPILSCFFVYLMLGIPTSYTLLIFGLFHVGL